MMGNAVYQLSNSDWYQAHPQQEVYILSIQRTAAGLATIASDQTLSLLDPKRLSGGPITSLKTNHKNLGSLKVFDEKSAVVCTAGENGEVAVWDLRSGSTVSQFKATNAPILSMACNPALKTIAVGTELQNHTVSITLWDVRSTPTPQNSYKEVHSDDITTLTYHPTIPSHLLSGSTDGLVNIYDTAISDEDDVIIQTFNHTSSVHHASFLTPQGREVGVLSHDEQFAVYDMAENTESEEGRGGAATVNFGDLREVLGCQYVADILPKVDGSGAVLGAGSQDNRAFELVFLAQTDDGSWNFKRDNSVGLPSGHGSDIVRSYCLYDDQQLVFTAGEDGKVKAWKP